MTDEDDTHIGYGLDDHVDRVLVRMERELAAAPSTRLSPLGWLCAVVAALGDVGAGGQRFAEAAVAHQPHEAPGEEWLTSLRELALVAFGASDAHSLHSTPGDHANAEVVLAFAFWEIRSQVLDRNRHDGDPVIWTARLTEQVGAYVSTLLSSEAAAPTEVGSRRDIPLQLAGPAALVVAAMAMLAASVALRDAE